MSVTVVYDCVGEVLGTFPIPSGVLLAGYMTGSGNVPWTDAQFAAHPGAIHIDQSPVNNARNETADVIDMEDMAATLDDLAPWVNAAWANFKAGTRPGQRTPTVYASANNITPVVNTLLAHGITSGVNLWVAHFGITEQSAEAAVNGANGPFPIVGFQFANLGNHDVSVFSTAWLQEVSKVSTPPAIPTPGIQQNWHFCNKCKGLFYFPEQSTSHCPAGGTHNGSHSHDYIVVFIQ